MQGESCSLSLQIVHDFTIAVAKTRWPAHIRIGFLMNSLPSAFLQSSTSLECLLQGPIREGKEIVR
jgi:hypothetical protein